MGHYHEKWANHQRSKKRHAQQLQFKTREGSRIHLRDEVSEQQVKKYTRDALYTRAAHTMTNPEPEQYKTANSDQMTLRQDYRLVYTPGTKVAKSLKNFAPTFFIGAIVIALLWVITSAYNNSTGSASKPPPTVAAAQAQNPSLVASSPFAVIAEPSQEWMTAFEAVLQAAYKSEEALLSSSMSQLVRLQPSRTKLSAQQRTVLRAHTVKGLAATKADSFADAAEAFLAAFQIDPTDAEVADNLGFALYMDGKFEPAIHALLQSLGSAPRRGTAWGNLGKAYAHVDEPKKATAALGFSLRYAKSPRRTRNNLISLYQEDTSTSVRSAAGNALAIHYMTLVDQGLLDHLGTLSPFPFSALLPKHIQATNVAGTIASVYVLDNADFPIKADATEYAVWLGSDKGCRTKACIVGHIAGSKSQAQTIDQAAVVELAGGVRGVLHKASEQQLASLTIERAGIIHRFSFSNEAELVQMANSALNLGPIPVSVFAVFHTSRRATEASTIPQGVPSVSTADAARDLAGLLSTSPKGPPLGSRQIYEKASNSVVMVTAADGQGSGVVVAPEIVVTNYHVTKLGDIAVHFRGMKYPAMMVAGSEHLDYCILKAAGLPAAPAPMGALGEVAPGQRVYSLGSPRGFELTFAEGMVSALRPSAGMPLPIIQTTAPISPGSSGGGLFDEYGRVIGLTTFTRVESQNLNFAMPVELYRYVIQAPSTTPPRVEAPVMPIPAPPPVAYPTPTPNSQPWPQATCNIRYNIDLQTFGENVAVELRSGVPGSSRIVSTQRSQGGMVSFNSLCPGSYFIAIGNDDYVSVTPVRQFSEGSAYTSKLTMQRGSGNVSSQQRKNL